MFSVCPPLCLLLTVLPYGDGVLAYGQGAVSRRSPQAGADSEHLRAACLGDGGWLNIGSTCAADMAAQLLNLRDPVPVSSSPSGLQSASAYPQPPVLELSRRKQAHLFQELTHLSVLLLDK